MTCNHFVNVSMSVKRSVFNYSLGRNRVSLGWSIFSSKSYSRKLSVCHHSTYLPQSLDVCCIQFVMVGKRTSAKATLRKRALPFLQRGNLSPFYDDGDFLSTSAGEVLKLTFNCWLKKKEGSIWDATRNLKSGKGSVDEGTPWEWGKDFH